MKYIYSLYDVKTGELVHKGTPGELVKAGVYNTSEEVSRRWGKQHMLGIAPRKWRIEREEAPVMHRKRSPSPDGPTRMVWVYRMYDAAGQIVCQGTAVELVEKGLFRRPEDVANANRAGHRKELGVVRIARKKELRKIRVARGKERKKREPLLEPKKAMQGIGHPDALQLDVHALCGYNAAARELGHKELSYGYWAEKGKPEVPV